MVIACLFHGMMRMRNPRRRVGFTGSPMVSGRVGAGVDLRESAADWQVDV
jgi:hypothetical protein